MKKKILIINGYYFPARNYGGPSTSICNMVNALNEYFDFYIIAHDHDYGLQERLKGINTGWNEYRGAQVIYLKDTEYRFENFVKYVKNLKIDLIYNSGFYIRGVRNFLWLSRLTNIPVVVAPRGELNAGALQQKNIKKTVYLSLAKVAQLYKGAYFHSTCEDEHKALVTRLHIPENRILDAVNFPSSVTVDPHIISDRSKLKIFTMGRVCRIKNLAEGINGIIEAGIPIVYDIYGPIEDKTYYHECQQIAAKASPSVEINFCGNYDHETVGQIVSNYDAMLTLTLSENYGQTIAEAIMAGCPVIISKGTTPWDEVEGMAGYTVSLGEKERLIAILRELYDMSEIDKEKLSESVIKYASIKFKTEALVEQYKTLFYNVIVLKNR